MPISVAAPTLGNEGWQLTEGPGGEPGPFPLHRVYTLADPSYTGKVTVPTLWDRETGWIVSNESSDILRIEDYQSLSNHFARAVPLAGDCEYGQAG